ncbi:hypothetical protein CYMTET_15059, partial [Cymbomonas tetramitiformis]
MAAPRFKTLTVTPVCSFGNATEADTSLAIPANITAEMLGSLVRRHFGGDSMDRLFMDQATHIMASDMVMAEILTRDANLQVYLAPAPQPSPEPTNEAIVPRRGGVQSRTALTAPKRTRPKKPYQPFTLLQNGIIRAAVRQHLNVDSKGSMYTFDDPRQDKKKLPVVIDAIQSAPEFEGVNVTRIWGRLSAMSALQPPRDDTVDPSSSKSKGKRKAVEAVEAEWDYVSDSQSDEDEPMPDLYTDDDSEEMEVTPVAAV